MPPSSRSGTRISHVGIAVKSLAENAVLYRDILGLPEVPLADSDGARIMGFDASGTLVELLEPGNDATPVGKFMAKRGPAMHHLCFSVADLDATLARCKKAGIRLIDEAPRVGAEGKRIAFLHPGSTGGVLIELSEH
jgi:methylmalonyl-CoA/ethylmalonyl-CoA epimerase